MLLFEKWMCLLSVLFSAYLTFSWETELCRFTAPVLLLSTRTGRFFAHSHFKKIELSIDLVRQKGTSDCFPTEKLPPKDRPLYIRKYLTVLEPNHHYYVGGPNYVAAKLKRAWLQHQLECYERHFVKVSSHLNCFYTSALFLFRQVQ